MNLTELNKEKNYKEYNFSLIEDCCGVVSIKSEDFEGTYEEIINNYFEDEDEDEIEEETPLHAVYGVEEYIKEDIEKNEGKTIDLMDIINYDFNYENMNGTCKIGVNFK